VRQTRVAEQVGAGLNRGRCTSASRLLGAVRWARLSSGAAEFLTTAVYSATVSASACSGFTHIAGSLNRSKATFVTRLQPFRSPGRDQSTILSAPSGRTASNRHYGPSPSIRNYVAYKLQAANRTCRSPRGLNGQRQCSPEATTGPRELIRRGWQTRLAFRPAPEPESACTVCGGTGVAETPSQSN
jgi:hypothetical protein